MYTEEFINLLPTKWWKNFFNKFKEIDSLPVSDWSEMHQLAYFCKRYYDHYGFVYSFSLKGAPSKCPELFLMRQVIACLGTSNQKIIKEYIDWIFDIKIIPTNKKIKAIGFLVNAQFCNEFKLLNQAKAVIKRTTVLPIDYLAIISELKLPVKTYGDLAFAKQALDVQPNGREAYQLMFNKLYTVGFEYRYLDNIK